MTTLQTFTIQSKQDVQNLTTFLRTFYDTTHGVPLSLACSASYLQFRVKCLQSLQNEIEPCEAYLGDSIHVVFDKGVVTVTRRSIQTQQNPNSEPPEEDDKDNG